MFGKYYDETPEIKNEVFNLQVVFLHHFAQYIYELFKKATPFLVDREWHYISIGKVNIPLVSPPVAGTKVVKSSEVPDLRESPIMR